MTDEEIRGYLRQLRDEPPPADSLVRVRARIEERVASERRGWFRWQWAVAAMASVVLVALIWLQRVEVEKPEVTLYMPSEVVAKAPLPAAPPKAIKPRVRKPVRAKKQNVMRIQTEDPEVVLMFITEGGEE